MKKAVVACLIALVAILMAAPAWAVYDITAPFGFEVVLTKDGIVIDLSKLEGLEGVERVEGYLVYRSSFDPNLAVYIKVTDAGARVRWQVPIVEQDREFVAWKGIDLQDVALKKAVEGELKGLVAAGIIRGLAEADVKAIVDLAEFGRSGFDAIQYEEGKWTTMDHMFRIMLEGAPGEFTSVFAPEVMPDKALRLGGGISLLWPVLGAAAVGAVGLGMLLKRRS